MSIQVFSRPPDEVDAFVERDAVGEDESVAGLLAGPGQVLEAPGIADVGDGETVPVGPVRERKLLDLPDVGHPRVLPDRAPGVDSDAAEGPRIGVGKHSHSGEVASVPGRKIPREPFRSLEANRPLDDLPGCHRHPSKLGGGLSRCK